MIILYTDNTVLVWKTSFSDLTLDCGPNKHLHPPSMAPSHQNLYHFIKNIKTTHLFFRRLSDGLAFGC